MDINKQKITTVAFLGKPNVGKSTLFNALLNGKYAITSPKPQTTRNQIFMPLVINENEQIILIDTPGFHEARNKLDEFLNNEIKKAIKNAHVCCFIHDMTRELNDEDLRILKQLQNTGVENKILIINKAETSTQTKIDQVANELNQKYHFNQIVQISALHKINLEKLLNTIKLFYVEGSNIDYPKELSDEFITSEIIREQCILLLKKEIPYGVGIQILNFKYNEKEKLLLIEADIIVEKDSQKPIVIGKGGKMIKEIGTKARKQLLDVYDCRINLKLFVKVKKDWRNNNYLVNSIVGE